MLILYFFRSTTVNRVAVFVGGSPIFSSLARRRGGLHFVVSLSFAQIGNEFNILRMEFETAPDVAEERPSLPMEVEKPVAFALRVLFTVCCDVFAMHELVEGKLHRVFAIGETIVAVEAIDEPGAELFVEFAPGFVAEDHFFNFYFSYLWDISKDFTFVNSTVKKKAASEYTAIRLPPDTRHLISGRIEDASANGRIQRRFGFQQLPSPGVTHKAPAVRSLDPKLIFRNASGKNRVAEMPREYLTSAASEDGNHIGADLVLRVERRTPKCSPLGNAAGDESRSYAVRIPG